MSQHCQIKTTCPYCGVGCGVDATIDNDRIIAVSGDRSHPANLGKLCVKGSALPQTMGDKGRLKHPIIEGQQVDWPTAIKTVAHTLTQVRDQYGSDAIAFYLSGQLLTEDYYVANKFAKGFIGTGHVDTNSRLCMSSAVAGYKRAFGSDAVPCNYEDLEQCNLLVLTGSNAAWTHPVLYRRMAEAKNNNPDLKVVVIDPRRTASCDLADLHLAITPGSDHFIFTGLLNFLASNAFIDQQYIESHTEGFTETLANAEAATVDETAAQAGLNKDQLITFYQWFAETDKVITFYSQGINQSATGTDKCNAIINCHLATGRLGKLGAGPFSITGQPNAMGGREVGGLANMLAAHMDYTPENITTVAKFWRADNISQQPGLKAVELFDAVSDGRIKAIWIMGTNPVVSMPNADIVKSALEHCEHVIVSDCMAETDTTATANILLPATGWGEKDGTVTNSERRISRQRGLLPPLADARHDWWILCQVAQAMGYKEGFSYSSPRDIFVEHAALSTYDNDGKRLFDIGALSNLSEQEYGQLKPIQWPVTASPPHGTSRLFVDRQFATPSGKAQFISSAAQLPKQSLNNAFPFSLNSGRIRDQWHTMTRTGHAERLLDHIDQPFVAMHPKTAGQLALDEGDLARVSTAQGAVQLNVMFDAGLRSDQLFVPIHWNDRFARQARIDTLVAPITDAISGQPEFKFTPAAVTKVELSQWAVCVTRNKLDCSQFINWSLSPLENEEGYLYWIAVSENYSWQDFIAHKRLSEQGPAQAYEYFADASVGDERFICYSDQQIEMAIFTHSNKSLLPNRRWLQNLLGQQLDGNYWQLITQSAQQDKGKLICSCFQVGEQVIVKAIKNGARSTEQLGQRLKCGTNCGSCIPELSQLINATENLF